MADGHASVIEPSTFSLDQCALAAVTSPAMLASRLSTTVRVVSVELLEALALSAVRSARPDDPKAGKGKGGEPENHLRDVHVRIHELLSQITLPRYAAAIRNEFSVVTEPDQQRGQDTQRFDPVVQVRKLVDFFELRMLCTKDVAALLGRLLTVDNYLPAGSRSSPILSYLINRKMFDAIALFAAAKGLEMTLHVNDSRLSVEVCSPRPPAGP